MTDPSFDEIALHLRPDDTILVCSACLRASCWMGDGLCDEARGAATVQITVSEARRLNREHPDTWRKLREMEGRTT